MQILPPTDKQTQKNTQIYTPETLSYDPMPNELLLSPRHFEIEYIIHGTGQYFINGKPYPIRDNMLFFMSPASFHSITDCDAMIINIMFPCNLCDPSILFRLITPDSRAIYCSSENSILIEHLLGEIVNALSRDDNPYAIQFLRSLYTFLFECSLSARNWHLF